MASSLLKILLALWACTAVLAADDGMLLYNMTVDVQNELNMELVAQPQGIHLIRVPKASSTSLSQVSGGSEEDMPLVVGGWVMDLEEPAFL